MNRRFVRLLAVASWALVTQAHAEKATELAPNDFAYGAKVLTQGVGAAYRVSLPLAVYQTVTQGDLRDVRVFNERNELVPSRIERPRSQSTVEARSTPLPLFTLRGDPVKALDAIRVTIDTGDTRVEAQTPGARLTSPSAGQGTTVGAAQAPIASYIIDARSLKVPIAVFTLSWPDDAPDFAGRVRMEASDDLGMWRIVSAFAPVANLRAGDARITERRIELAPTTAKFWRVSWVDGAAPFEITAVAAEPARDRVDVTRTRLEASGTPVRDRPGEFEFDLGARVPADRITLMLPEQNSIVEVELLSRDSRKQPWQTVATSGFYRLRSTAGADLTNGPIVIAPTTNRYWLARVDTRSGGLGKSAPKLSAGWLPHDVVFLARGSGPFTLAYGNAGANTAVLLGDIPQSVSIVKATLAEPHSLGGMERLSPDTIPRNFWSKSTVLWIVLAIGVALLAFMAYRLAHELKDKQ